MVIGKYYAAVIDGGGGATEVVEEKIMSAAEAMAKHGQKSDENSVAEPIDIKKEVKEVEKKVEEVTPTAKVEEETKTTEKPASETPQEVKKEEPEKVEKPIAEQPAKVQTLDEVLKTNQPEAILKALGFDDDKVALIQELKDIDPKLVGIIQSWKSGQLGDYVKELSTDYSKMEPEDVMRHQLRVDYPKATERQLEILYKDEVIKKFNLDSDDEDEVAEGKELLAAKADKFRDSFIANQDKYLMPKPPEPKAQVQPDNSAELKAKENVETYVKQLTENAYTKDIIANKKITVGEGEEKFSYPVDPDALIGVLSDGEKWAATMYDAETGELKTEHQLLLATVAEHGMNFLNAYAVHMKGLGGKEVTDKIDNASKPDNSSPAKADILPTSAAALMAKQGKRSNGG